MKCETCQALLVDFVSGELSGNTLASATTHIATCARCKRDVQVLREGLDAAASLPMLTPPESVRAHVLQAAARANAHPAGGDLGKKRGAGPSWWWRVLSRFGELATSPQVAMATVLLLMIAVGTYYLPANEEAPHAALSPLDPDALEAEKNEAPVATATALPDSDQDGEEAEATDEAMAPAQEPAARGRQRMRRSMALSKGGTADRADLGSEAKKPKRREKATAPKAEGSPGEAPRAPAPARSAPSNKRSSAAPQKRSSAPRPFPALAESDDSGNRDAERARPEAALGGATASGAADAPSKRAAPLTQANAAFEARNYAEAARLAEAALATPGVDADAARWLAARSYRASGDCRRALPHYVTLRNTTRRFPRAWIEGAQCLHKLGDTGAANTWLTEAEQMPAVRAEARQVRARFSDSAL